MPLLARYSGDQLTAALLRLYNTISCSQSAVAARVTRSHVSRQLRRPALAHHLSDFPENKHTVNFLQYANAPLSIKRSQ